MCDVVLLAHIAISNNVWCAAATSSESNPPILSYSCSPPKNEAARTLRRFVYDTCHLCPSSRMGSMWSESRFGIRFRRLEFLFAFEFHAGYQLDWCDDLRFRNRLHGPKSLLFPYVISCLIFQMSADLPSSTECLPGVASSSSAPVPSSTATPSAPTSSAPSSTAPASTPTVTGFVKTSGQKFMLNGAEYAVAGTNAYWLAQVSDVDIDTAFSDIANAGLTTVRTW